MLNSIKPAFTIQKCYALHNKHWPTSNVKKSRKEIFFHIVDNACMFRFAIILSIAQYNETSFGACFLKSKVSRLYF